MLKSYWVEMSRRLCGEWAGGYVVGWVAHGILLSAQVPSVLTLGLWTWDFGLGLDNKYWSGVESAKNFKNHPHNGFGLFNYSMQWSHCFVIPKEAELVMGQQMKLKWTGALAIGLLSSLSFSELHYIIASLPIDLFLLEPRDFKMRASDLNTRDMRREGRKTFDLSDSSDEWKWAAFKTWQLNSLHLSVWLMSSWLIVGSERNPGFISKVIIC